MESIDYLAWSALVGTVLPVLISFFKGANMTKGVKQVIAIVISIAAAVITTAANEGWMFETWQEGTNQIFRSFAVIFALAHATYKGFWEDRKPEVVAERMFSHAT